MHLQVATLRFAGEISKVQSGLENGEGKGEGEERMACGGGWIRRGG